MINEICLEIKNWFDRDLPKFPRLLEIRDGKIVSADFANAIQEGQYFRIIGSVFNDGVYKYTEQLELHDEIFDGAIWLMAVPQEIENLAAEVTAWKEKYGEASSSPFNSESFGGYSYTKASGGSGANGATWQAAFKSQLDKWRKI